MKKIAFILSLLLFGCSQEDYSSLEKDLPSIATFEPLADKVLTYGKDAIIDLRDKPVRLEPADFSDVITAQWLRKLQFASFVADCYNPNSIHP